MNAGANIVGNLGNAGGLIYDAVRGGAPPATGLAAQAGMNSIPYNPRALLVNSLTRPFGFAAGGIVPAMRGTDMVALRRGVARYANGTPDVSQVPGPGQPGFQGLTGLPLTLAMEQRARARNAAGTPGTIEDTLRDRDELQRSPAAIAADFARMYPERMPQVQDQQRIFGLQAAAGQTPGGESLESAQSRWEQQHPSAASPAPAGPSFREMLGNVIGMHGREAQASPLGTPTSGVNIIPPGTKPESQPITSGSPLGSIGDLLTGGYANVLANPNASAFSQYLAQSAQDRINAQMNRWQIQNLTTGPSNAEKLVKGLFGTQADWKNIQDRDAAATALGHPLAQQRLLNDPNELAKATQDPVGYSQSPDFTQYMKTAVDNHNAAHDPGGVMHPDGSVKIPENPYKLARVTTTTGATLPEALASTEPHQYTREEFANIVGKMPVKMVEMMFGHQLAHVATPQEDVTKTLFGTYTNDFLAEHAKTNQLMEAGKTLTGSEKAKNMAAIIEQQKREKEKRDALMNAMSAPAGVGQKQFPLPPGQTDDR
jgi:hypothetical protein